MVLFDCSMIDVNINLIMDSFAMSNNIGEIDKLQLLLSKLYASTRNMVIRRFVIYKIASVLLTNS